MQSKQAHTDVGIAKGERDGAKQGIVRFWEEWCGNPSGSCPNFFGRQHLTFDKGGKGGGDFRGIVLFWEGWCGAKGWCDNPSGSRPNFFGRQHLTFDKGGKRDGAGQGIVQFWKGWCNDPSVLRQIRLRGY